MVEAAYILVWDRFIRELRSAGALFRLCNAIFVDFGTIRYVNVVLAVLLLFDSNFAPELLAEPFGVYLFEKIGWLNLWDYLWFADEPVDYVNIPADGSLGVILLVDFDYFIIFIFKIFDQKI